jgi:choline dehydrogenase-like flavoprotein
MLRLGVERYALRRLHIDPDVPVVATLDFESADTECNRVEICGGGHPRLHWSLHPPDETVFAALLESATKLLEKLKDVFGVVVQPLGDYSSAPARARYLHEHATDAYHFGGGIPQSVLDHELRLKATPSVFVVSGAVFRRPGLANPTLTLLALAHRCADAVSAGLGKR